MQALQAAVATRAADADGELGPQRLAGEGVRGGGEGGPPCERALLCRECPDLGLPQRDLVARREVGAHRLRVEESDEDEGAEPEPPVQLEPPALALLRHGREL